MSATDGPRLCSRRTKHVAKTVLMSVMVFLFAFITGCSSIEGVINDSLDRAAAGEGPQTRPEGQSSSETNPHPATEPEAQERSGPQPGTAKPTELPSAELIDGCDESTCSVSDAVTFEHLYQGAVTVVLFADFSKHEYGECKVAVLSVDGETAQVLPLEWTTVYSMTGGDLTNIFYFLDPATDATKNIFFRMPGTDGWSASGLRPLSTGYFELFDLGYIVEDFSEIFDSQPMTDLAWGELDANGNYELKIEEAVARWDGQKYSAP